MVKCSAARVVWVVVVWLLLMACALRLRQAQRWTMSSWLLWWVCGLRWSSGAGPTSNWPRHRSQPLSAQADSGGQGSGCALRWGSPSMDCGSSALHAPHAKPPWRGLPGALSAAEGRRAPPAGPLGSGAEAGRGCTGASRATLHPCEQQRQQRWRHSNAEHCR